MNYHIVRMNEKVDKIAHKYNLSVDEIKVLNQHISNWDNIVAGSKIILPNIPERIKDEINDIEPFIEDYYPKISDMNINLKEEKKVVEEKEDVLPSQEIKTSFANNLNKSFSKKYYNNYYPPYFHYYPYYPMYDIRRVRKK